MKTNKKYNRKSIKEPYKIDPRSLSKTHCKKQRQKTQKNYSKSGKWSPKEAGIGVEEPNVFVLFRFQEPRRPQDPHQGTPKGPQPGFSMHFQ